MALWTYVELLCVPSADMEKRRVGYDSNQILLKSENKEQVCFESRIKRKYSDKFPVIKLSIKNSRDNRSLILCTFISINVWNLYGICAIWLHIWYVLYCNYTNRHTQNCSLAWLWFAKWQLTWQFLPAFNSWNNKAHWN